ncbi:GNAT family N-acetyltransferase [Gimesia algae]|uniref:N-acyltransferase YncA n=1 Tax=Gimesia algae TaxID=2527971 RepID=A0A517VJW3_9PLAN|nr:GNAT family N-acetyltransferase [Gimesia algae]QDT93321.1 N-acyltransferase YncA [Gimesia algae]
MIIRPAVLSDLEAMTEIYNEAILTSTATFDIEPMTRDERLPWFESHDERHPILVAEVENQIVGWSCLSQWRPRRAYADTAETSFYVKTSHRGRGIGRQLKQAIIEEARRLGYHILIAGVAEGNEVSLHLNQSLGFEVVGTFKEVGKKFGKVLDVTYLQLMLN